jgi:hypothetical protein
MRGSIGEVGEHLRARAMLLAGSMGPKEHRRRRSTVVGGAEEAVAGDELAPGRRSSTRARAESYVGRGRWGSGSPVRTTMGWSGRVAMARAEWSGSFGGYRGKRRDNVSQGLTARWVMHGVAAACVVLGADVAVGQQRWCEVAAAAAQLSRACDASPRAPFKRPLRMTGGLHHFFIYQDFQTPTL